MPRPRLPEDRAWENAAALILDGGTSEAVTWTLIVLRGQLSPGHPLPALLEQYRACLRGERSALTDDELAPLYLRVIDIVLLAE